MYAIEGYSHAEIALMLSINEGTSRSQLSKARNMMKEKLYNKTDQHENGKA
jgi:DNA-directed RNA polymerase specialized sigma24 family protein